MRGCGLRLEKITRTTLLWPLHCTWETTRLLHIHNSLTKKKEPFQPLVPGKVSLYVCGSTVYDYCHIGHARSIMVVFDMVTRYLRLQGYDVHYVRNITDIDDKIIQRANERGEATDVLTERFIQAMREDEQALSVLPPNEEPRATAHIPEIVNFITRLIEKGDAYVAENGDVYFQVASFADYGKFSHQSLEKLRRGARVDILDVKRDPLDFVLWKMAKPDEPSWDSPWGKGRPGWHIECSAMCASCLGEHIDLHGGGLDLIFPHHQNEIAQSESLFGNPFVKTWMHVGYIQVDREKMSKSVGNFTTIREILAQYPSEVIRYFLLASHYRSPINYSQENLNSAKAALERLYTCLRGLDASAQPPSSEEFTAQFQAAMDDDFNTPLAFAVLFDLVREINRYRAAGDLQQASRFATLLKKLAEIFGILQMDPESFLQSGLSEVEAQAIEQLIADRNKARSDKDWQRADELRQELTYKGIILEDSAEGTTWRRNK